MVWRSSFDRRRAKSLAQIVYCSVPAYTRFYNTASIVPPTAAPGQHVLVRVKMCLDVTGYLRRWNL